jgi:hypothetical protein
MVFWMKVKKNPVWPLYFVDNKLRPI